MAPQSSEDWVVQMANGRMPENLAEIEEMTKQMNNMGLKGAYNPANVYPGSPFTPSSRPEPEEVREVARSSSQKILPDWNTLRKIVELHADTLEKRWMKKSRKKQRELLLKAWPDMSANHRPDFEAYREECTGRLLTGMSKFQEAYKWPYINQQDLSSRSPLFSSKAGRSTLQVHSLVRMLMRRILALWRTSFPSQLFFHFIHSSWMAIR